MGELNSSEGALGSGRGEGEQVLAMQEELRDPSSFYRAKRRGARAPDSEGGGAAPLMLVRRLWERGDSGEGKRGRW
jgi:hypothetical protein